MICGPGPSSLEALIERFNEYLMRAVVQGRGCMGSQSWMDGETTIAIEKVAAAHPNPDPALIKAARAEFAKQLDGTHTAEAKAKFDAEVLAFYPEWPQTPFAESVRMACEAVLTYMYHREEWESLDRAHDQLVAAADHSAHHHAKERIVEHLHHMLDELKTIPEYELFDADPEWDSGRFAQATRNALKNLVTSVEDPEDGDLDQARQDLESTAALRSSSSLTRRDRGIIVDHLRVILDELETIAGHERE